MCEERLDDPREARRRLKRPHLLAASGESGESIPTRVGVVDDMRELIVLIDSKLAQIFYGAGVAVALTGAYVALLAPSSNHKPPPSKGLSWHVLPTVGPSAARVTWEVSF